jgi:hypothetical protein
MCVKQDDRWYGTLRGPMRSSSLMMQCMNCLSAWVKFSLSDWLLPLEYSGLRGARPTLPNKVPARNLQLRAIDCAISGCSLFSDHGGLAPWAWQHLCVLGSESQDDSLDSMFLGWRLFLGRPHLQVEDVVQLSESLEHRVRRPGCIAPTIVF